MATGLKSRLAAAGCALLLLLCAVAAHPVAEIGMNDDGPYLQSAQALAATGHVVYNGWATAMIGWQLFLGGLFAKLFGGSYTAVRASTLLVAMATAFLAQRTLVRAGVNLRNATVGAVALVLSPLFLPLAVSFMTDIGGMFALVLCLYACLRALEARSDGSMLGWLVFAAASNALGGTVRQVAWLGLLTLVPSTVWLLRRRRHAVGVGAAAFAAGVAFLLGALRWFARQPYSIPDPLLPEGFLRQAPDRLVTTILAALFCCGMFLLPVLVAFVPGVPRSFRRPKDFAILAGMLAFTMAMFLAFRGTQSFAGQVAPYPGNYVTQNGLIDGTPIKGARAPVLPYALRAAWTIAIDLAIYCLGPFLYTAGALPRLDPELNAPDWKTLGILLGPFSAMYVMLLTPRGATAGFYDRYVLPLVFVGLLLLLRLLQERVQPHLPALSYLLLAAYAVFAVAGTHDAFSLFRAKAEAFAELRRAGIPATRIDGGFEENGKTQIDTYGHMNDPRIRVPAVVYLAPSMRYPEGCGPQLGVLTPAVVPEYALSFDARACGGPAGFAPVSYGTWLGGRRGTVFVVRISPGGGDGARAKADSPGK